MNTHKGLGKLVVITCVLAVLCAFALFMSFFTVSAQAEDETVTSADTHSWYEITESGYELVVHLQNYEEGYKWKYGMSAENLNQRYAYQMAEYETKDDLDDDYAIHFTAAYMYPTDTTLTFSYVRDRESEAIETRTLRVLTDAYGKLEIEE